MRLDRNTVERQISEMWDALPADCQHDERDALAAAQAERLEKDLREQLAKQDRMDLAAPRAIAILIELVEAVAGEQECPIELERGLGKKAPPVIKRARELLAEINGESVTMFVASPPPFDGMKPVIHKWNGPRLDSNCRVRVVISGCAIETTADKIQSTLVREAFEELCANHTLGGHVRGMVITKDGVNIQIDLL